MVAAASLAPAAAQSGQAVRRLAQRSSEAVVALDHRVGVGGGFLNSQRAGGENLLDSQARSTGFLISADGHVVTHARFVQGKTTIRLYFHGGSSAMAKVLGVDPLNRTALLQLVKPAAVARNFGGKLPHLAWGDSTQLVPGNTVFSLGNCFESLRLDGQATFSQGVVTTVERSRLGTYRGPIVETDASVNPGSFGGPLLNAKGEVIGVITRNVSDRRWLGAAVPAEQVKRGVERILAGKPLAKGLLGVALESTGGEAARGGLRVARVQPGSGAAAAGLATGDLLLSLDGQRVYDTHDVARELNNLPTGALVRAMVRRGDAVRVVPVILGDGAEVSIAQAPANDDDDDDAEEEPQGTPKVTLGLRLQEMDNGPGLQVVEVQPGSAAAAAGVKKDDILAAVGRERVRTTADLTRALLKYTPGQRTSLIVVRGRRAVRLAVQFGGATTTRPEPTPAPAPEGKRPTLGVRVQARDSGPGLEVIEVRPNTPAAAAGLAEGDVILAWGRTPIRGMDDLGTALRAHAQAQSSQMLVMREGRRMRVRLPSLTGEAAPSQPAPARPRLGVRVETNEGTPGLKVSMVQEGSRAAAAGIQAGDVIIALARRQVRSTEDLGLALDAAAGRDRVQVVVLRGRQPRRLVIDLSPGWSGDEQPTPSPEPAPSSAPGYLGVYLGEDDSTAGVGIEGAVAGSPADAAGIRTGDRILRVDGALIADRAALGRALRGKRAGDTVRLVLARQGGKVRLSVTLGVRGEEAPRQPANPPSAEQGSGAAYLGASLQDGDAGVTVVEVAPGGPLAKAGLRGGDVLVRFDGKRLSSVEQFAALFKRYRAGQQVSLEVSREGWSKTVTIRLGSR